MHAVTAALLGLLACRGGGKDHAPPPLEASVPVVTPPARNDPFPLAKTTNAWFVVDWGMDADTAERALRATGVEVERQPSPIAGEARFSISVKVKPWRAYLHFASRTELRRIEVDRSDAPSALGAEIEADLSKRFGAAPKVVDSVKHAWRSAEASVVAVLSLGETSALSETRWSRAASGAVGIFDLDWRMTVVEVRAKVRKQGFETEPADGIDADGMLGLRRAESTGHASFGSNGGPKHLDYITLRTLPVDASRGHARLAELAATLGTPTIDTGRSAKWTSPATDATLRRHSAGIALSITYQRHGATDDEPQ